MDLFQMNIQMKGFRGIAADKIKEDKQYKRRKSIGFWLHKLFRVIGWTILAVFAFNGLALGWIGLIVELEPDKHKEIFRHVGAVLRWLGLIDQPDEATIKVTKSKEA